MVLSSGSFLKLYNLMTSFFHIDILFLPSSSSLWICAPNLHLFFSNAIFMALGFYIPATTWFFSYCLVATFCQLPPGFIFSGTVGRSFWSTLSYLHPNPFVDEPQGRKLAALCTSLITLFLFKIQFSSFIIKSQMNCVTGRMNGFY